MTISIQNREAAVARARANAPFLRAAIDALPSLCDCFLEHGASAAADLALSLEGDGLETRLRRRRHGLALATALGDLAGEFSLEEVTRLLSDFADSAIDQAISLAIHERVPDAPVAGFAVIALGKLGSHELNYSSDVDLAMLFDPELLPRRAREEPGESAVRIGRRVIEILQRRTAAGYVERVDLRLRPSPEVTPIALPVDAAISHYESSAQPWERAAFIRARAAAGDIALGQRFLQAIQPFVWRRSVDFGVIEEVRAISVRIRDHFARHAHIGPGFDLKRGRGGIREVEFFVQIQQMIHGGRDPSLRAPATLDAITRLLDAGHLEEGTAATLADSYRTLRTIEHRLQMIADAQTHRLPDNAQALDEVARLHGLGDGEKLIAELRPRVEAAGALFDALIPTTRETLSTDPQLLRHELSRFGFPDPDAAARYVLDWRSGRARSLRSPAAQAAFEAMLPGMMAAIAAAADPSHALNRFADIVDRLSSGVNLFRMLEARPALARTVALILAHAPALAEQLARRPTLLDGLIDQSSFAEPPDAATNAKRFLKGVGGLAYDQSLDRVRAMVGERRFALGVQLIAAHRDPIAIAQGYSDLAEGAIIALSELTASQFAETYGQMPGGELVVLALGRLGGRALTHASDLDLIYLYDVPEGAMSNGAKSLSAADFYNRLASRITTALGHPTAAGPLYDVDTRLRPQGAQGMLAVSLEGFEAYQQGEAWTWEHMALCRARPLTGSTAVQEKVCAVIHNILCAQSDAATIRKDAAAMRDEISRHKPPAGPLDIKLGPGGLVDLEFAVHTLQLMTHVGLSPRLEVALTDLVDAGLIDDLADPDLRLLSRILVVLRLVASGAMEPAAASRDLVATLCGAGDWDGLLAATDEARQRIAERWNKVKDER